jgi:hypothetical protein
MQTITTVGYGDIGVTNTWERIFVIFTMLIGVLTFSFISGTLSSIMLAYDERNSEKQQLMGRLIGLKQKFGFDVKLFLELQKSLSLGAEKQKSDVQWLIEKINAKPALVQ